MSSSPERWRLSPPGLPGACMFHATTLRGRCNYPISQRWGNEGWKPREVRPRPGPCESATLGQRLDPCDPGARPRAIRDLSFL